MPRGSSPVRFPILDVLPTLSVVLSDEKGTEVVSQLFLGLVEAV